MRVKPTEEEKKARAKAWRAKNKERVLWREKLRCIKKKEAISDQKKLYYTANKEKILEKKRLYRIKNKEKEAERERLYRIKNKQIVSERKKLYRAKRIESINFRLSQAIRGRIRSAIKSRKCCKTSRWETLLSCSIAHARQYLESQFLPGMTWENHGLDGWHIDHIKPCASFDLTDPEQQKACFHYTNLQPLWATDNLSKGKKVDWQPQRQSAQL